MTSIQPANLLALPMSSVYRIVDMTRPFDFENMLLACKHIYHVGEQLVHDHNSYKNWLVYKYDEDRKATPYYALKMKLCDVRPGFSANQKARRSDSLMVFISEISSAFSIVPTPHIY
jgi:hypothetical protein